jgi:hypothetical protein
MSYTSTLPDFPRNILILQHSYWYDPCALHKLCSTLTNVYFPVADQRLMGFTALSAFKPAPFALAPPIRFPSDLAYCTDYDPVLAKLFSQLRGSLSFKDRLLATSSVGVTDRVITSMSAEYLAAFNAFQNALNDLVAYANDYSNYYDRLLFESTFSLTWS